MILKIFVSAEHDVRQCVNIPVCLWVFLPILMMGAVDSTMCAAMKNGKKYWTKKQEKAQVGTYTGTFNEKRSYGKFVTP